MADDKLRATPAARKLADDLGINLYDVSGSGANGRVHKEDVETYKDTNVVRISPLAKRIALEHNIAWQEIQGTGHRGKIMKKDVLAFLPENIENDTIKSPAQIEKVEKVPDNITPYGEIERIPMTPMRKVIAQRMVESYLTAPTFTLNYDVDMSEMLALRKKVLEPIMEATGKKITVTDLLSLAVVKTLMKHPYINASLTEDGKTIITLNYVNLAMAVGMDNGLMTPVVYNAEKMSLSELVVAFKDVIGRTLEGKLAPSELQNSTFTISNLGMFGVQSFGPIINQPNSAILGVSSTIEKPVVVNGEIERIPMTPMRKVIAQRMVESYLTAPTFTLNYDVDMSEMLALRKKVLEPIMEATGKKITVTDLLSLAVVKTLMKHPYINASLTEDAKTIVTHNYVNLAMAVGMDNGLMTPVVYNAEKMSLSELVVAFKDVIGRTLDGKLAPSELQNSTFTISNLGMFGVQSFGPIINQPNSAILGVSSTIEKPVVVNGEIVIRPIMSLGLTIDHRVVDGMAGAKFMKDLKTLIENPISMLV